jgi:hypothetical protein
MTVIFLKCCHRNSNFRIKTSKQLLLFKIVVRSTHFQKLLQQPKNYLYEHHRTLEIWFVSISVKGFGSGFLKLNIGRESCTSLHGTYESWVCATWSWQRRWPHGLQSKTFKPFEKILKTAHDHNDSTDLLRFGVCRSSPLPASTLKPKTERRFTILAGLWLWNKRNWYVQSMWVECLEQAKDLPENKTIICLEDQKHCKPLAAELGISLHTTGGNGSICWWRTSRPLDLNVAHMV